MLSPHKIIHGSTRPIISWESIDTVLVDMDGTLLDLAFDNFFWHEIVPSCYAKKHGVSEDHARTELLGRYKALEGCLAWYCIDHWSEDLGLDIRALKREHRHLIRFLPGTIDFLTSVRKWDKRLLLVTNAHPDTLAIKIDQTRLDQHVNALVSSHEFRSPKETREFWERFHADEGFDPLCTILIDDSVPVLQAASEFGVGSVVGIRRPDSRHPPRPIHHFPAVDGVCELTGG